MNTRRLVINAILTAIYVVLSLYATIRLGFLNISLAAFPVLVAGFLYGWKDGLIVGTLGSFLSQLLTYGLMVTTPMWMLPTMVRGFIVGWYAQHHDFALSRKQEGGIVLISCLVVTILNTIALYVDSQLFHYPVSLTVVSIALRFVNSIITAVIFTLVVPGVVRRLRAALGLREAA